MKKINLHLYPSPFKFESRILKETASIIKLGLASQVIVLSSGEKGQLKNEFVSDKIQIHRIIPFLDLSRPSRILKALFYVEFYVRALFFGMGQKIDIVNCHSLMMLPLAVFLKKTKGIRLVYDPHELETERLGLHGVRQKISKIIEHKLISECDATIVVSDSIKNWYICQYRLKHVFRIRNTPHYFEGGSSDLLRKKLNIPNTSLIFIYQGLLNEGRGLELYLSVFSKMEQHHLVIMGYGSLDQLVKDNASKFSNIHFHPAVKPQEVLEYTQSADIGLSLIENCCLSYYYSLPNKFFEYLMAELPLVVSDFPDMAVIVKSYDIGWAVDVSEEGLICAINSIDKNELMNKKRNLRKCKKLFNWEVEELTLVDVFATLYQ